MTPPLITAIILTRNSASTLSACIASVMWCDELLIADDHSSDQTRAIALQYNARVITLPPTSSFAEKRNAALQEAQGSWVLFVDADEIISKKLQYSIQQRLSFPQKTQAYQLHRLDSFLGKTLYHGETGHMWFVRLAQKNAGLWERRVHEIWHVKQPIKRIRQGVIYHDPHPSLESFFEKINRYTELEVQERTTQRPQHSLLTLYLQLVTYPLAKFGWNFVFKGGFLDGTAGYMQAYWMSLHSLIVRIKMIEYIKKNSSDRSFPYV